MTRQLSAMTEGSGWSLSILLRLACVLAVLPNAAMAELPGPAPTDPDRLVSERVVRVAIDDPSDLDLLAEDYDLWAYLEDSGEAVLALSDGQLGALSEVGFAFAVDIERTDQLARLGFKLPGQTTGIPGYPCYRTVEETLTDAAALAAANPAFVDWIDIGDSWEKTQDPSAGHDLRVLRLTRTTPRPGIPRRDKPRLFVMAGLHPREYTTVELALRFAEDLVRRYDVDPEVTWLLDEHEIHLLLLANPDGRQLAEGGLSWRKNTNSNYCGTTTSRGADLNRNFSFRWDCCGGSSDIPCDLTYHGASAASEPETAAIEAYLRSIFPDQRPPAINQPAPDDTTGLVLDLHSFGEDVLWSWGFTNTRPPAPNGDQFYTLGRKYGFFTHYAPRHGSFGTVDGPSKDFSYGELGVPGFTIELGLTFFEGCEGFENVVLRDNLQALLYSAKVVRTPYQTPAGPEVLTPSIAARPFAVGEPVQLTAQVDDTRYTLRNGVEPVQSIAGAEVFVGRPPWDPGAFATPLKPVDGVFDQPVEQVEAILSTAGLGPGRHLIYVQGIDATGQVGAPSATFLHLIDPLSAPFIEGTLRDAGSSQPLAGTVRLGDFEVTSDGASGFFRLQLPPGSYEVVAETPDHAPRMATVEVGPHQSAVQDFVLDAWRVALHDDAEDAAVGWIADPPWARSDEVAFSPSKAWSDSPGGDYPLNVDVSLTSPRLDLTHVEDLVLDFQHLFDIKLQRDYGRVEISSDDGFTWHSVAAYSGYGRDIAWQHQVIPLPQLAGQSQARLRFRLQTGAFPAVDGWHLDDIRLRGVDTPEIIFLDGFESGNVTVWSSSSLP